jgi:signal transduction histidine kinase
MKIHAQFHPDLAPNAVVEHQQLLEAGRVARRVAHDFNNQLAVIIGCADLARRDGIPPAELAQLLGQIRHAGELAKQLVQPLRELSRPPQS